MTNITAAGCARVVVVLLPCMLGWSCRESEATSRVVQDLGIVRIGSDRVVTLELRNDRDSVLRIAALKTSCSCMVPGFVPKTVAPGQEVQLSVRINRKDPGPFAEKAVALDEQGKVLRVYEIRALVEAGPEVYPSVVEVSSESDLVVRGKIRMPWKRQFLPQVTAASAKAALELHMAEWARQSGWLYGRYWLKLREPPGRTERIAIVVSGEDYREELSLKVRTAVGAQCWVSPRFVLLDEKSEDGTRVKRQFRVGHRHVSGRVEWRLGGKDGRLEVARQNANSATMVATITVGLEYALEARFPDGCVVTVPLTAGHVME